MSGYTPCAILKSTGLNSPVTTSFASMMAREMFIKPSVCDSSGEGFNVQLRNSAFKSEKSQIELWHNSFCVQESIGITSPRTSAKMKTIFRRTGYRLNLANGHR